MELVTIRALRPDPLEFHRTAPKIGGDCGFGVLWTAQGVVEKQRATVWREY